MSLVEMEEISKITDWFASLDGTFLRLFDVEKPPYVLPRYATNKRVMKEVSYHLTIGLLAAFQRKNKSPCPTLLMQIGLYKITNLKVADAKGKEIDKFAFSSRDFNSYNTRGIFKNHCARILFQWLNGKFHCKEEGSWKNSYNAF